MKVSVVMCSYNVARFIDQAIQSIIAQTYTNWELIISDDASTDNTVALIEPYLSDSRIKLFRQPKNLGYVRNKNFALQQATGDLITQLDSDDTSYPERLEKQVSVFLSNPEVKACAVGYNLIDEQGKIVEQYKQAHTDCIKDLMLIYPFSLVGIMLPSCVWKEIGYYDEYFAGSVGEDHYLVWKVNMRYPIALVDEPLTNYRINYSSVTNTFDNPRKLIGGIVLEELYNQMQHTGSDWLEKGNIDEALEYEASLLRNNDIMAERYRIWAAKAIDNRKFNEAKRLLRKSLKAATWNLSTLATVSYYIRKRYLKTDS